MSRLKRLAAVRCRVSRRELQPRQRRFLFVQRPLVDVRRKKCIKLPPTTIQINNKHEVTTTTLHKFLGVILDDEL